MPYQNNQLTRPDFPNQRGSTCGLYALEGVMRALDPATPYRATKDHKNPAAGNVISLRDIAKNTLHISVIGEIFNASDLAKLAKHVGLNASLHAKIDWNPIIVGAIDLGKYVLAPFGVDPSTGQPQLTGKYAHWCVIFGYACWAGPWAPPDSMNPVNMPLTINTWPLPPAPPPPFPQPPSYALVRHWGQDHIFFIEQFRRSSQALQRWQTQYWQKEKGAKNLEYSEVSLNWWARKFSLFRPHSAKRIPAADLPNTLADQLVVLGK